MAELTLALSLSCCAGPRSRSKSPPRRLPTREVSSVRAPRPSPLLMMLLKLLTDLISPPCCIRRGQGYVLLPSPNAPSSRCRSGADSSGDARAHLFLPSPSPPLCLTRSTGNQIVNEKGEEVILKGAGLGGWLNMENFIVSPARKQGRDRVRLRLTSWRACTDGLPWPRGRHATFPQVGDGAGEVRPLLQQSVTALWPSSRNEHCRCV
jgi:hypothetical protein